MKNYVAEIINLTGDTYLNPQWPGHVRALGVIETIAVHHDASIRQHDYDSAARYRSEAQGHYAQGWPGLQYHFKIDNTGQIFQIRPLTTWLWHCGDGYGNERGIAICLDGYFHPPYNQVGTREQYEALKQLLDYLSTPASGSFPADQSDVWPHRHFSATACCGDTLVPFVDGYRNSMGNIAIPDVPYDWPEYQPATPAPPASDPAPTPPSVTPKYKVFKDGKQIGAYNEEANAWNKYKAEGGQIITADGADVTAQLKTKYEPPVPTPPPAAVPKTDPADTTNANGKPMPSDMDIENNGLLKSILNLLKRIAIWFHIIKEGE